jgi:toxin CptA
MVSVSRFSPLVSRTGHAGALPVKLDAPYYTDEELDALYEIDPVRAMRISREQAQLQRRLAAMVPEDTPQPSADDVREVLQQARAILLKDGGDLEFVSLDGGVLTVRMKGACAGCPRAPLDMKNVVERLVRARYPGITAVRNVF